MPKLFGNAAARIRHFRAGHGISQEELAVAWGVSQKAVALWEHGEREPSIRVLYIAFERGDVVARKLAAELLAERMPKLQELAAVVRQLEPA